MRVFDVPQNNWEVAGKLGAKNLFRSVQISLESNYNNLTPCSNKSHFTGVYLVFVFRKKGQSSRPQHHRVGSNPPIREDDFIRVQEGQSNDWD